MPDHESYAEELRPILNQTRVEHDMLAHARDALASTLDWQTVGETFTRKLSSLRFAVKAYHEHLERVLAIEECDGYIDFICEESPWLTERVNQLRAEHDDFRAEINEIATKLDRLLPTDHAALNAMSRRIQVLLEAFTNHSERELALLQTAMNDDIGAAD